MKFLRNHQNWLWLNIIADTRKLDIRNRSWQQLIREESNFRVIMELGAGNKLPKKETILSKTGIMTDSHSGILEQEAREKKIHVLPMPLL